MVDERLERLPQWAQEEILRLRAIRQVIDDNDTLGDVRYRETIPVRDLKPRPEIVCLCGSTRFYQSFSDWNFHHTLHGRIVLSIGCDTKRDGGLRLTAGNKRDLDELHKRKIDLCDFVFVINEEGYIGESTRGEIAYARSVGKPVKYLHDPPETEDGALDGR